MIKRHLAALLITVFIYYIPLALTISEDWFWVRSATCSMIYITLIHNFAKTRISAFLISLEFIAMFWHIATCYTYFMSPESQLFDRYYGDIMSYCYGMQILTIMGGATGGRFKRIYHLWTAHFNDQLSGRGNLHTHKGGLCTKQQEVSSMR